MKKKILFLICMLLFIGTSKAQLKVNQTVTQNESVTLSPLAHSLTDFIKAVNPSSFERTFAKEKDIFLSAPSAISTPAEVGKQMFGLCGYIKAAKLKPSFRKAEFMKESLHTTTLKKVKGLLKNLEINMVPDAMMPIWRIQRNGWLETLNNVH